MESLPEVCKRLEITLTSTLIGHNDEKKWPHFEWRVTLSRPGKESYSTIYKTGVGHIKKMPAHYRQDLPDYTRNRLWLQDRKTSLPPTLADVVSCLIGDAISGESTFEDFCSDLGYNPDSLSHLQTYLACQKTLTAMRRLLGADFETVAQAAQDY